VQAALDKVLGSHDLMGAPLLVVANKQVGVQLSPVAAVRAAYRQSIVGVARALVLGACLKAAS
jgi:hypothetical protein